MKLIIPLSILILMLTASLYFYNQSKDLSAYLKPESTLTFHIIGDFGQFEPRSDYKILPCKQVANSMNKQSKNSPISMIITTGDNFYVRGDNNRLFSRINSIFTDIFTGNNIVNALWFLSYGNHDMINGKNFGELLGELYPKVRMPSGSWNLTKVMIGYKIDFTVLQPDIICHKEGRNYVAEKECETMDAEDDYTEVYKWLEKHLKDLDSDPEVLWRIVVLHYPIFSVATTGLDSENLKIYLLPLLRKYKVDLVLSGHNHNMQYFVSYHGKHAEYVKQDERNECLKSANIECEDDKIHCVFKNSTCGATNNTCENEISIESSPGLSYYNKSMEFKKGEGLHQVVQGGGGSDLDSFCPNLLSPMADYVFGKAEYGFTEVKITKAGLFIQFIAAETSEVVFKSSIYN